MNQVELLELATQQKEALVKLEKENKALVKSVEEKDELIAELNSEVSVGASKKAGKTIVTHEKVKYEVVIPKFSFEGVEYTAKDVERNEKLVAGLIKIGSGVLSKIN